MKSLFTFLAIISFSLATLAQNVSQSEMAMSEGIHNAYNFIIENASTKYTKDVWKDFFGNYGKVKKNRQKELYSLGASVPSLMNSDVDIFGTFESMGDGTLCHLWIKGGDEYISDSKDEAANAKVIDLITEFTKEVAREKVRDELTKQEKNLKSVNNELTRLIKENEKLHKDIENYKARIKKAEGDIEKNLVKQETTKEDVEKQKEVVQEVQKRLSEI